MNWKLIVGAHSIGTVALASLLSAPAQAVTTTIVTDSTWATLDVATGDDLGPAEQVCLNASSPPSCPAAAIQYGYPYSGWSAAPSTAPSATWIWAPGITGTMSPAAFEEYSFERFFYLCGTPQGGTIALAADNSAEVFLNGASTAALTSSGPTALSTVSIAASALVQGLNVIRIHVTNAANPSDCGSDQYRCNPAGVLLAGSFSDALSALPTCSDNGRTYSVGQFEALSCPAGQTGSSSRPCICIGTNGVWGPVDSSCVAPPPTCIGQNGTTFAVGATETLACPPGQTGSQTHICGSNGSWGPTSSTCKSPPPTCTDGGTTFSVGQTETLPCPSGQVGSRTRVCGSAGAWGAIVDTCQLPPVNTGDWCGSVNQGVMRTCPTGTSCSSRTIMSGPRTIWCALFGIDCPTRLQTADWYCDP